MHTTEQLNTALMGRYEIEGHLGQGGMATVYLARDIKHHRRVALKVLSPELAAVLGRERFLSEIEVTANLQHPHLLPLFDSGEAGGLLFYVMPYVQGETLRKRLERERQLTVDDAIRIAAAIGSALDYAHRQGVIHRDLKPENILMHERDPLVMDFGIALAVSNAGGARVTQSGISLGTPQYMSPEQATGDRQVDGRSDVYSLAVVLYEMLGGDPPHMGTTVQAVIAKVLTDKPPSIRATRETVPEHVERALVRALAKLPADRFATAAGFVEAITGAKPVLLPGGVALSGGSVVDAQLAEAKVQTGVWETMHAMPTAQRKRVARTALFAAFAVAAAVTTGAVGARALHTEPAQEQVRFIIDLPDSLGLLDGTFRQVVLARDGSRTVNYFSPAFPGPLYTRRVGELHLDAIPGSDSARSMVLSPDSRHVLFWRADGTALGILTSGRLMKIAIGGGSVVKIADSVTHASQASWGDGDQVIFRRGNALVLVSADGGRERPLAQPDTYQAELGWPQMLPGGKAALITIARRGGSANAADSSYIGVVAIRSGKVTDLGIRGLTPHFASGHLLYVDHDGQLFAALFDPARGRVTGEPRVIARDLSFRVRGVTDLAVADNGTIMFTDGGPTSPGGSARRRSIIIKEQSGKEEVLKVPARPYRSLRASPDGERIALSIEDSANTTKEDVWLFHRATGQLARLTRNGMSRDPIWSPDGKRIIYRVTDISQKPAIRFMSEPWDQSGSATPVLGADGAEAIEFSAAGGYMAIVRGDSLATGSQFTDSHIFIAPIDTPLADRPLAATALRERMPRFSPNGKWLAYVGHELTNSSATLTVGASKLYVRPVPGPGPVPQVSIEAGNTPMWSRDGRTLYYFSGGGIAPLTAARLSDTNGFEVLSRNDVFARAGPGTGFAGAGVRTTADMLPDGSVVWLASESNQNTVVTTAVPQKLVAIINWLDGGSRAGAPGSPPR